MAIVITVAQQKGGAGKTTLVANLAAALAATRRVAVLDIDPQHTLVQWHALRAGQDVPAITLSDHAGWRLASTIDQLRANHDVVVIDSAPQVDHDARRAIRAASVVLVPVQPSPPDIWAAGATLRLVSEEKRAAHVVLNRAGTGARVRESTARTLLAHGLTVLPESLGNRAAFNHAFGRGLGVTEDAPRSAAAAEMWALLAAVLSRVTG